MLGKLSFDVYIGAIHTSKIYGDCKNLFKSIRLYSSERQFRGNHVDMRKADGQWPCLLDKKLLTDSHKTVIELLLM